MHLTFPFLRRIRLSLESMQVRRLLLREQSREWLEGLVTDKEAWDRLTERGTATRGLLQGIFAALLRGGGHGQEQHDGRGSVAAAESSGRKRKRVLSD